MNPVDELYRRLARIAKEEFLDIVASLELRGDRLRIHIVDGSFLDVWFSRTLPGKYAFHWERRHIDGTVYRWDNAAHRSIAGISTYPHHFHEASQRNVKPYRPKETWEDTLREILNYIRNKISAGYG